MRSLIYGLVIYVVFLAFLAYGADRFYYWMAVCSLSTLFGGLMGNLFGSLDPREMEDDRY